MRVLYSDPVLLSEKKKDKLLQFINCKTPRNDQLSDEDVWVINGKIVDPEKVFYDMRRVADIQVDCQGLILSPGFIDIQLNGGFGYDFTSSTPDTIENDLHQVAKRVLQFGVTAFCPTVISSEHDVYHKLLPHIKRKRGNKDGAGILET
uniref:N-acetylglucosamine-6-phosphate deacetylase n=1 Tax=Acrobeloides nanus TaxID=290746 RepID=A0A914CB54_9BILA